MPRLARGEESKEGGKGGMGAEGGGHSICRRGIWSPLHHGLLIRCTRAVMVLFSGF